MHSTKLFAGPKLRSQSSNPASDGMLCKKCDICATKGSIDKTDKNPFKTSNGMLCGKCCICCNKILQNDVKVAICGSLNCLNSTLVIKTVSLSRKLFIQRSYICYKKVYEQRTYYRIMFQMNQSSMDLSFIISRCIFLLLQSRILELFCYYVGLSSVHQER